nr:Fur family transcriptional regulator [uncultured Desulfobacter sp.]
MCLHCDYKQLLEDAGVVSTPNRLRVLEVIGGNNFPLSAADIHETLERSDHINRVTVYRILDLLVEKQIVDRIATGGRAAYYGMAPNAHHPAHPHFYCTQCGRMDCLTPETVNIDVRAFENTFPGRIDKFELRIDGICRNCLKKKA